VAAVLSGRRWYVVRFEEYSARYEIAPISPADADRNGLADEWERVVGLTQAGQDDDGDGWSNLNEFVRGTDPKRADAVPKRMTVTGNATPLPEWNPSADNMTWSDQRARWEWSGTFAGSRNVDFKFSRATSDWGSGASWGAGSTAGVAAPAAAGNLSQSVAGGTRYLVHFDDQTGIYDFVRYPTSLDWLTTNGLANRPGDPWGSDDDNDGLSNLQEYAMGGNPNINDKAAFPSGVVENAPGASRLVLRWLERTNGDASLTFVPQMTTDLMTGNWSSLVSSNAADTSGVPANHRRKEVSVPIDGSGKFLRLRVNGP
jgi:hypothetical protein